jgi:hypothetical protein
MAKTYIGTQKKVILARETVSECASRIIAECGMIRTVFGRARDPYTTMLGTGRLLVMLSRIRGNSATA